MTQGANVTQVVDLDALLATRELTPVPVKLGGKTYMVRRDLTGTEAAEFFKLSQDGKDVDALAILVTNAPVMLNKTLEKLPRQHMVLVVQKMMEAAGLIPAGSTEGESQAS